MNITVYLGANAGNDPALAQATAELGRWIGESGNTLVYGGSASGLMGVLAKSVLGAGGKAIGVEPQFFVDSEFLSPKALEIKHRLEHEGIGHATLEFELCGEHCAKECPECR